MSQSILPYFILKIKKKSLDYDAQSLNYYQKPTKIIDNRMNHTLKYTPITTIYNESFMPLISILYHFNLHLITLSLVSFPFLIGVNTMDNMSQLNFQNISTLTQGMKTHSNLMKFTQVFISVSVFSFIFSPSSLFLFLHYFKFYFSTFPSQLYTHNIDKNSMFLLCNGLLVFVGLTKSFSSSSSDDDDDKSSNNSEDLSSPQYIEEKEEEICSQSHVLDVEVNEPLLEREAEKRTDESDEHNVAVEEKEGQEKVEKIIFIEEEQEEEMKKVEEEVELFDADDEEEDKASEIDYILIEEKIEEEEEDYVEEEESCVLSTEELNKKFEDFIRKMKEDLRIDARRHLIMV